MESVPGLADRPVIFISAYGRDAIVAHYIVKPFPTPKLTTSIRAALRRRTGPESFVLGFRHPLQAAPGDPCRPPGGSHHDRAQTPARDRG